MKKNNVYIIAGPNGSGKTTFAKMFLPEYAKCGNFINADLIAQGLSPFSPEKAALKSGKLVLEQIKQYSASLTDFGFETTLSGKLYANLIKGLKKRGYNVHIYFLWVPNPEVSLARIKERVAEGGHNIPKADVIRRYTRSIDNFFQIYRDLSDYWMLFDNSGQSPKVIADNMDGSIRISNEALYSKITKQGII
ncbi:MAG: zeta toxin family protein [Candidatus Firestonebacteria bacterium]